MGLTSIITGIYGRCSAFHPAELGYNGQHIFSEGLECGKVKYDCKQSCPFNR
jgi:hypothetical protein